MRPLIFALAVLLCAATCPASYYFGESTALVHQPCFDPRTMILTPGMKSSNVLVTNRDFHIEYMNFGARFLYAPGAEPKGSLSIRVTVEAWGSLYLIRDYEIVRHSTVPISVLNFEHVSIYMEAGTRYTLSLTVTGRSDDFNADFGMIPWDGGHVMTVVGRPILYGPVGVPEPTALLPLAASGMLLRRRR